jgi:hypothetical protein
MVVFGCGDAVGFGSGFSSGVGVAVDFFLVRGSPVSVGDVADLRLLPGPGEIGRTGSNGCERGRLKGVGVRRGVSESSGVFSSAGLDAGGALAAASEVELGSAEGVDEGDSVSLGEDVCVALGDGVAVGLGDGEGGRFTFLLVGAGVGVGVDFL